MPNDRRDKNGLTKGLEDEKVDERSLNIIQGIWGAALSCTCLLRVLSSYVIGKVETLPYSSARFPAKTAYLGTVPVVARGACCGGLRLCVAGSFSQSACLLCSMLFFASNARVLGVCPLHYSLNLARSGVLHLGQDFSSAGTAQIWTLANYVLTTREAKARVVIGVGAHAGWILRSLLPKQ